MMGMGTQSDSRAAWLSEWGNNMCAEIEVRFGYESQTSIFAYNFSNVVVNKFDIMAGLERLGAVDPFDNEFGTLYHNGPYWFVLAEIEGRYYCMNQHDIDFMHENKCMVLNPISGEYLKFWRELATKY